MATAGLGYDIAATTAWLYDLDSATIAGTARQRDMMIPLCRVHADKITVPVGWELVDRRVPTPDASAAQPAPADASESIFASRSHRKPKPKPQPQRVTAPAAPRRPVIQPAPSSLLERAFRAAPRASSHLEQQ